MGRNDLHFVVNVVFTISEHLAYVFHPLYDFGVGFLFTSPKVTPYPHLPLASSRPSA